MDFDISPELKDTIARMDAFIAAEIKPLEDAHPQYFDHRREHARTNWDEGGIPTTAWEELLCEMRRRADRAPARDSRLPRARQPLIARLSSVDQAKSAWLFDLIAAPPFSPPRRPRADPTVRPVATAAAASPLLARRSPLPLRRSTDSQPR